MTHLDTLKELRETLANRVEPGEEKFIAALDWAIHKTQGQIDRILKYQAKKRAEKKLAKMPTVESYYEDPEEE